MKANIKMEDVHPNTKTGKREIITEEKLKTELFQKAEAFLQPWIQENDINFANVILAGMRIVEEYTSQTTGLSSEDKLKCAIDLLPLIVDYGVKFGKIGPQEGDELKGKLATGSNVVKQVISAYVMISKNPYFIQIREDIEEFVAVKCCGKKSTPKKK